MPYPSPYGKAKDAVNKDELRGMLKILASNVHKCGISPEYNCIDD